MSIKNRFKSFFALEDEEYEYVESEDQQQDYEEPYLNAQKNQQSPPKQNVVSLQSIQKSSKVILCEPRVYAEAQEIADQLKNRRAVIVNLQSIQRDQAKRIVDFLSGTVYAIGGDIQKVGMNIFLCTPDNVDVSGSISELVSEEELQRW